MKPAGDFYTLGESRYCLKAGPLSLELDRLRRERHELIGELSIRVFPPSAPAEGVLVSVADFNVSSLRSRQDRAKFLLERAGQEGLDLDFFWAVEYLCQRVLTAERAGLPAVHLRDVDPPGPADIVEIDGWKIPTGHPSCVFGDGGALKSLLALWAAGRMVETGLRVLYLDWEFSQADHRDRFGRLFASMPDVLYRRCERPMVAEADSIRRIVRAEKVNIAICDSVVFACDGPPEAAETAAAYFRAERSFGIGTINVAHINRSDTGDKKPFGSTFWHNGFRTTWFVERAAESPDGRSVTVGLFNRKNNLGAVAPAAGFRFDFDADRIVVGPADIASESEFSARVPLWQRMAAELRGGPMTMAKLAEVLDAKMDTIKKTVERSKGRLFTRVTDHPDGIVRIGLLDRRAA